MATRWGIISAGLISSDFVSAMQVLPKEEHQVVAVAARSLQDAKNFAAKFDIEKAYGSYSEVANDPNVDVVYIGTIQTYHLPVATEMLKAGKAVLCEKPLCMNVRETRQLIQTAQECGVFFMEVRLTKMVGRESGFHYVSNVSFLLLHQNVIETV
uniref:Trans-1,2-dihydrobenzene-1,2-diol dehydrogenase n=1 Tax=Scylla olivacea TaxID=85551 RepID=A0A0P4WE36_SCYOL